MPLLLAAAIALLPGDVARELAQVESAAGDVRAAAARLGSDADRSIQAGRPVALAPLESDVVELQEAVERLEKQVAALERARLEAGATW